MSRRYGVSVSNLLHPTDFSHGSDVAFAHALKIAVQGKCALEILHVDRQRTPAEWDSYPSVRDTLSRWGMLPADASRSDVARLGVNISKSACTGVDTATGVLDHIRRRDVDLVIMATHHREGLDRWLHGSLAEKVANHTEAAALFVPYGGDGFVDLQTGLVSLKHIVVPVDSFPSARMVIDTVAVLADAIATAPVNVSLLHVGDPSGMPSLTLPVTTQCRWTWESRTGNVVDAICEFALEQEADLVAMATNGHDGFLDVLRGSTTERVLSRCQCPLLTVHQTEESS